MKRIVLFALGLALLTVVGVAAVFLPKLVRWRHIDATYSESFPPPATLAPSVAGQQVLFHIKTGLKQDDSQFCAGFNVILAALQAHARVTVIFDSGAVLDLNGSRLAHTRVPLRLQKMIVAQTHIDPSRAPHDYAEYLRLLHALGAAVYADTDMNVLTGVSERIGDRIPSFAFVQPISWAGVVEKIAASDVVIVY